MSNGYLADDGNRRLPEEDRWREIYECFPDISARLDLQRNYLFGELTDRVAELESFEREWKPFILMLAQSLAAMAANPMFGPLLTQLPPQAQALLAKLANGEGM